MTGDFFLTEWFFLGMRWLCENVLSGQIFLTILVSTLILRLLMLYSDIKQRKSTARLQELQPKINQLQERYKNDPRKLQLEQSKIMKENGVSMFGGCLPMLLTIPLLFCFIAAFRFWGYEQNVKMLLEMDQNIQAAQSLEEVKVSETFLNSKFLWVNNIWQADNGFVPVVMTAEQFFATPDMDRLIYFRDNPDALESYNMLFDMESDKEYYTVENYHAMFPEEADNEEGEPIETQVPQETETAAESVQPAETEAAEKVELTEEQMMMLLRNARYDELVAPLEKVYEGYNNGMFLLPILSTAFQFLYAWYMQRKQAKSQNGQPQQGAGMGKFMLYLMPAISFIFCLSATAAFAVYWTLSSFIMLAINLILAKVYTPGADKGKSKTA